MGLRIRGGSVIGRQHYLAKKNRQDSFAIGQSQNHWGDIYVGVVSDGCGSTKASEVGANLISNFAVNYLLRQPFSFVSLPTRLELLESALVHFLEQFSQGHYALGKSFVGEHLLATMLGFVAQGTKMIIFSSGDGYIFLNDHCLEIDEENRPSYFAYNLLLPETSIRLNQIEVDLSQAKRVAIATDGFEPELINNFWGKENPAGVQCALNIFSQKRHFSDDATLITVEKTAEGGEEDESPGQRERSHLEPPKRSWFWRRSSSSETGE